MGIFAVMAAGCAIASSSSDPQLEKTSPGPRPLWQRLARNLALNCRWSLASFVLTNTIPFIMPWIIDYAAGAAAAGLFGASATLVGVTNVLVLGGSNFLMPRTAEAFATRSAPRAQPRALRDGTLVHSRHRQFRDCFAGDG